jgi:hypothetical protein
MTDTAHERAIEAALEADLAFWENPATYKALQDGKPEMEVRRDCTRAMIEAYNAAMGETREWQPKETALENWQWWVGENEDRYSTGPCATREEAIAEALDNDVGFEESADGSINRLHLCEALMLPPSRLADYLDLVNIIERADEKADDAGLIDPDGDQNFFNSSENQFEDLRCRLKRACDEWQQAHGLVFQSLLFKKARNAEFVELRNTAKPPKDNGHE